ncbi:MAG: glycosyltransferase family 9 protein [Chlorobi bacterium]|nr:glycosyltransferase family 9 protein [Chlorobiota bacterium]
MNSNSVKFLFIRFSSIGDIILTTPLLRALKTQIPNSNIQYLLKKEYYNIIENNPYIDKIHLMDNDLSSLIPALKIESFDYIIDLHRNVRSLRVKRTLKRFSISFKKLNFKKWLYVNFKLNYLPDIHIVDRYFETLSSFDVKKDFQGLNYFLKTDEFNMITKKFNFFNNEYIAFVIGAKHATKRLPENKIIEICDKIEIPVVLLGDGNDFNTGEKICSETKGTVFNACGKLSLNQSVSAIKHSKLIITHDTGLMHISAALHKNIISVWGNTVPTFGMYPYMPGKKKLYAIVEVKNLKCRPCSKIGFTKCPKKHFKCMNEIDVSEILNYVKEFSK